MTNGHGHLPYRRSELPPQLEAETKPKPADTFRSR